MTEVVKMIPRVDVTAAAEQARAANHRERVFLGVDRDNPRAEIYSFLGKIVVRFQL